MAVPRDSGKSFPSGTASASCRRRPSLPSLVQDLRGQKPGDRNFSRPGEGLDHENFHFFTSFLFKFEKTPIGLLI